MTLFIIAAAVGLVAALCMVYRLGRSHGYDVGVSDAKELDAQLNHLEAKLNRADTISRRAPAGTGGRR